MQKRTVRGATVCHDGDLVSFTCHCAPLAAQPPATRARRDPQSDTLVDALERGHRVAACRGRYLVGSGSLSLTGPRGTLVGLPCKLLLPGPCCLAGARGASRQVPWSALVGLPGKLLLPGPCLLSLNTLFLNGSKGTTEDLGVRPASLCRGVLQLPVHKFGVLGYPYSSTPTGAPGPGPNTVPSAVGPGPRQGTGTCGLGHAESRSVSTALSPNGTR